MLCTSNDNERYSPLAQGVIIVIGKIRKGSSKVPETLVPSKEISPHYINFGSSAVLGICP